MIASRKISDLHPSVAALCNLFIEHCDEAGIDVLITSTFRDNESQDALYAQGRTTKGAKVTNAKGGESFHNYRVAFDFVPMLNGKCAWSDTALFTRCGKIAQECGLEWGGSWKTFKDRPHCQYTKGLTIQDFKAGKTI